MPIKLSDEERARRRERRKARSRARAKARDQRDPTYQRRWKLRAQYGLTIEQYDHMVICQDGKCAICMERPAKLVVDHCHATGKVRQLLCGNCNRAIGIMRENAAFLRNAAEYVEKWSA